MRPAVVCTPLRVERTAVRGVLPGLTVARTGMGARRSITFAGRSAAPRPILVAGVGGGLNDTVAAGELVVATEVRGPDGTLMCPSAPLLAGALRRGGARVHLGPVVSSPGVVAERERLPLAATGALAVDMESAQLGAAAGGGPLAVVRAVVDTPARPLLRPGTPRRGLRALRALRAAAPALQQWVAATGERELLIAAPASVRDVAVAAELVLVLGSADSPEARRTVAVAERAGATGCLVEHIGEVDLSRLIGVRRIGIVRESTTHPRMVDRLVQCLSGLGPLTVRELDREAKSLSREVI